jgi:hypothetical protein
VHPESSLPTLLLNKEVCHTLYALAIYIKKYLKAKKKNYDENSIISPRKNIIVQKIL